MTSLRSRSASVVRRGLARLPETIDRIGPGPTSSQQLKEAGDYWSDSSDPAWSANSHWRAGLGDEAWLEIGRDHLAMFTRFAKALDRSTSPGVVVEWGCGGGANAAAFAPLASAFVATDVSAENLAECRRQVTAVCDTPLDTVVVDIAHPELVVEGRESSCDTFMCLYVFELVTTPEEALRLLRVAEQMLVPGGMAFVQFRYHTPDWRPPRFKRNYRRNLALRTTFAIDDFWISAGLCGLTPQLMTLVPHNRLDDHYAYVALTKPE